MKVAGIVCEYNPYHNGHRRQIDILRKAGFNCIVGVMSGNFTQRGELAIADKYVRAEAAIRGGVDLILELPFPYSSLSSEGFARAGVHILSSLGIETLCFGSESADTELLIKAADTVSSREFAEQYSQSVKGGSAAGFFSVLSELICRDCSILSNDILAISYISAIKTLGANMQIMPVKRLGASFNSMSLEGGNIPSATALRERIKEDLCFSDELAEYIPKVTLDTFVRSQKERLSPVFAGNIDREILSFFKVMTPNEINIRATMRSDGGSSVADDGCGIVDRLCNCARRSHSIDEFLSSAYNSRFTDARINRVLLFALLGVSDIMVKKLPEYTSLLAANGTGRSFLSESRKSRSFAVVTKPADAPDGSVQKRLSCAADELYASAMPDGTAIDFFMKKKPFIQI